ncbi:MAG: hypothetical protein AAGG07_13065 [Planctomycetota bacterium]
MKNRSTRAAAMIAAIAGTTLIAAHKADAAIILNGDLNQLYDGFTDPWLTNGEFIIGNTAVGSLRIDGGSRVTSSFGAIGNEVGSEGTVTVTGAGSTWDGMSQLIVGNNGTGRLDIAGRASVTNDLGVVGLQVGSLGTVSMGSGTWTNNALLIIGGAGRGVLNIRDSGTVTAPTVAIGSLAGSNGIIALQQNRARLDIEDALFVGGGPSGVGGTGFLNIDFGGVAIGDLAIASDEDLILSDADMDDTLLTVYENGRVEVLTDTILAVRNGEFAKAIVTGENAEWTTGRLWVGQGGIGRVDIEAGGLVATANDIILGSAVGSAGNVSVDGVGSEFRTDSDIIVGDGGTSALVVADGGAVTALNGVLGLQAGSIGFGVVDDEGSRWESTGTLTVGGAGFGALSVADGGTLLSSAGIIGEAAGSDGSVTIQDGGSSWNQAELYVGAFGEGTFGVRDGATVETSVFASIGSAEGGVGEATVHGPGSLWRQSQLYVGDIASGTLRIENAGRVETSEFASIGESAGSFGRAFVDGDLSTWVNNDLFVGWSGNGEVTITGGATVDTLSQAFLGFRSGSTGAVTVSGDGSEWIVRENLRLGSIGTGLLTINQRGMVTVVGDLDIGLTSGGNMVEVDGMGSRLRSDGRLVLGGALPSSMSIKNGASLATVSSRISSTEPGKINVLRLEGDNSEWIGNGDLAVGEDGDGEVLVSNSARLITNGPVLIGTGFNSYGNVLIEGENTHWTAGSDIIVGDSARGAIGITDGGEMDVTANITFGSRSNSTGSGVITKDGSQMTVSGDLTLGDRGDGILLVDQKGQLAVNGGMTLGVEGERFGTFRANDRGTEISVGGLLTVGEGALGVVTLTEEAKMTAGSALFAKNSDSLGDLVVESGSTFRSLNGFSLGGAARARLELNGGSLLDVGGSATFGENAGAVGIAMIQDENSRATISGQAVIGDQGSGFVSIVDGGSLKADAVRIGKGGDADGILTVSGGMSEARSTQGIVVGDGGVGSLRVLQGGKVFGASDAIGKLEASSGDVSINGSDSAWTNSTLEIGGLGHGEMIISDRASATTTLGLIGSGAGGFGIVAVLDDETRWDLQDLILANSGDANLSVFNGGEINVSNAMNAGVADNAGQNLAFITVGEDGSAIRIGQGLNLGGAAATDMYIENGGLVTVGTETVIGEFGSVNLDGGHFEFGMMTDESFRRIDGVSGSLAGSLGQFQLTGFNEISDVSFGNLFGNISENVDTSEITGAFSNSGVLYGDGSSQFGLINNASGVVEVITSERMRFDGDGQNNGRFDISGGQLRFGGDLNNNSEIDIDDGQLYVTGSIHNGLGGHIEGRGTIRVEGVFTNQSEMAFSGGFTDIHGTFINDTTGLILTTGGGVTTFFDDVTHNGVEIKTSEGSNTVFLGTYAGAGDFTGDGLVQFEGLVQLGNSPAVVGFEGDVMLTDTSMTHIEIAGLLTGEFDAFSIGGDLGIAGSLGVSLLDGFELGFNQSFLIADVLGSVTGTFIGLEEGSLVSTLGESDLFITYAAGDGNDIALYTAIPSPGPTALFGCGLLSMSLRRRRSAC